MAQTKTAMKKTKIIMNLNITLEFTKQHTTKNSLGLCSAKVNIFKNTKVSIQNIINRYRDKRFNIISILKEKFIQIYNKKHNMK